VAGKKDTRDDRPNRSAALTIPLVWRWLRSAPLAGDGRDDNQYRWFRAPTVPVCWFGLPVVL
jgi:hypothetical protein